jgi:LAGLIDADG endonuclease
MESIVKYLDCGKVYNRNSTPAVDFRVYNLDMISSKIIPFFLEHKLQSAKSLDFDLFREACVLLLNGEHRTPSGLEKVNDLKSKMNKSYNSDKTIDLSD